jgi:hypothetical protein
VGELPPLLGPWAQEYATYVCAGPEAVLVELGRWLVVDVDRIVVDRLVTVEDMVEDIPPVDVDVVLLAGVVLPHPTRLEAMTMSSYQNVLVSPPYDSQPKYMPDTLGL